MNLNVIGGDFEGAAQYFESVQLFKLIPKNGKRSFKTSYERIPLRDVRSVRETASEPNSPIPGKAKGMLKGIVLGRKQNLSTQIVIEFKDGRKALATCNKLDYDRFEHNALSGLRAKTLEAADSKIHLTYKIICRFGHPQILL